MTRYLAPGEGGGFVDSREEKTPLVELAKLAQPIMEDVGGPFSVRLVAGDEARIMFRFPKAPTKPVELPVPGIELEKFRIDGWHHLNVTVEFSPDLVRLVLRGRFDAKEKAPWVVDLQLAKDTAGESGEDSFVVRDHKGTVDATTLFDVMQIRHRSGDPKYARFSDSYPEIDIEGVLAIATRYVKDLVERRHQAAQPQPAAPAPGQVPPPPEGAPQ